MANTTTEEVALPDVEQTEPDEAVTETAAEQPAEEASTTTAEQEPAKAENSEDDLSEFANLKEWADKKGYDLSTEDGQARAWKSMREAEQKMHNSTAKASELEKSITSSARRATNDDEPDAKEARIRALELKDSVNSFFGREGVDTALRPKMAEFAESNPEIASLVENGYLTVADLYHLVRGSDPALDKKLKAEGGKEALQAVANKQQAKSVAGHATTSDLPSHKEEDPFLRGFDRNEAS